MGYNAQDNSFQSAELQSSQGTFPTARLKNLSMATQKDFIVALDQ